MTLLEQEKSRKASAHNAKDVEAELARLRKKQEELDVKLEASETKLAQNLALDSVLDNVLDGMIGTLGDDAVRRVVTSDNVPLVLTRSGIKREDGTIVLDLPLPGVSLALFADYVPKMRFSALDRVVARDLEAIQRAVKSGLEQGEIVASADYGNALRGLHLSFSDVVRHHVNLFPKDRHGASDRPGSLYSESLTLAFMVAEKGQVPGAMDLDLAGLAVSMAKSGLVAHSLRSDVAKLVDATDLHSLPEAPPRLLQRACLVEVSDSNKDRLFGETIALGVYAYEGKLNILGVERSMLGVLRSRSSWWNPTWSGGDLDSGVAVGMDNPLTSVPAGQHEEHRAWAAEAARFLVVLGILLDTDNAPLEVEEQSSRSEAERKRLAGLKPAQKKNVPRAWITRRVSLSPRARRAASQAGAGASGSPMLPGRQAQDQTLVSGHLKRQPWGPKGAQRKWIWVESYEARRWVAPGPVKVVVTP